MITSRTLRCSFLLLLSITKVHSSSADIVNIRLTSVTKLASGRAASRESLGAKIATAQKKDFRSVALDYFSNAATSAPTLSIDVSQSDFEYVYLYCNSTGEEYRIARRDIVNDALGFGPSLSELLLMPSEPARLRSPSQTSTAGCSAMNYTGQCAAASIVTVWSQAEATWRATLNYSFFVHAQQLAAPAGTFRIFAAVPADPMASFRQRFQAFFQLSGYATFLQSLTTEQYGGIGFQVSKTRIVTLRSLRHAQQDSVGCASLSYIFCGAQRSLDCMLLTVLIVTSQRSL
jgi:hypothetical protein